MLLSTNVCWHFLISLVLYEQLTAISEGNFLKSKKLEETHFMKIVTRLMVLTLVLSAAGFSLTSSVSGPGPIPPTLSGPGPIPPTHVSVK
jgi:hypothetical protein